MSAPSHSPCFRYDACVCMLPDTTRLFQHLRRQMCQVRLALKKGCCYVGVAVGTDCGGHIMERHGSAELCPQHATDYPLLLCATPIPGQSPAFTLPSFPLPFDLFVILTCRKLS
jgi:hypothetical protein